MKLYRNGEYDHIVGKPAFFKASGECRPPKKGEWYISGAIPAAYRAPNDLGMVFHIAVPVEEPPKSIIAHGMVYHRGGPA